MSDPSADLHIDLGAYALDALDAEERSHFEAHLAECDACRGELVSLRETVAALEHAPRAVDPPEDLRIRTLAAVHRAVNEGDARRPATARRPRRRWALGGFAVAAASAAMLLLGVWLGSAGDRGGPVEMRAALASASGDASGSATVIRLGIGREIDFRSDTLPILPKGEFYEVWFAGPGDSPSTPNRISAGTFHPDAEGRSRVRLTAAVDPALYPTLIVSAEPGDGDPAPSGNDVLRSTA